MILKPGFTMNIQISKVTEEENKARDKLLANSTRFTALHLRRLSKIEKRVHRQRKTV